MRPILEQWNTLIWKHKKTTIIMLNCLSPESQPLVSQSQVSYEWLVNSPTHLEEGRHICHCNHPALAACHKHTTPTLPHYTDSASWLTLTVTHFYFKHLFTTFKTKCNSITYLMMSLSCIEVGSFSQVLNHFYFNLESHSALSHNTLTFSSLSGPNYKLLNSSILIQLIHF